MKEVRINEYLKVKLESLDNENLETTIYVGKKCFGPCKRLILNIPVSEREDLTNSSVDTLAESYVTSEEFEISPEDEFWAHCSNLQAWAENDYDTRILHSNLAFPLLRLLEKCGDPLAKKVLKEEVAKRLETKNQKITMFLTEENIILCLNQNDFETLLDDLSSQQKDAISDILIEKMISQRLNLKKRRRMYKILELLKKNLKTISIGKEKFIIKEGMLKIRTCQKVNSLKEIKFQEDNQNLVERLILTHNKIKDLKGIEKFSNLKELNLSNNQIETINGIESLIRLRKLNLAYNHISKIEPLSGLKKLKELFLSNNQIREIPNLKGLIKLNRIELRYNPLEKIGNLKYLGSLDFLNLTGNKENEKILNEIEKIKNIRKVAF